MSKLPVSRSTSHDPLRRSCTPHEQPTSRMVGQHLIADLSGIPQQRLQDEAYLMSLFDQVLRAAECHIVSRSSHKFPGVDSGVTGLFLLTESHAAFHSYPEHSYLAIDIFVCGDVDPRRIVTAIGDILKSAHIDSQLLPRRANGSLAVR